MSELITFKNKGIKAQINPANGQLVSLSFQDIEYFHPGGKPSYQGSGWKNSEIVAFPVFGPVNNYTVQNNARPFTLDQHGIARHLPFQIRTQEQGKVVLVQKYDGKKVRNKKSTPDNRRPEHLDWLPYTLEKQFLLAKDGLTCSLKLTNDSDNEMSYMIGWHPAFKVLGNIEDCVFLDRDGKNIATLEQVIQALGNSAGGTLAFEDVNSITYQNQRTRLGIKVSTPSFKNLILWAKSPDSGLIAIEPTSHLPVETNQNYFNRPGFESLGPGEDRTYAIGIKLLDK